VLDLLLSVLLAAQAGTVFTSDGGRLRGTVVDAGPTGVTVQLPDGATRKLDAAKVSKIDYADGTTWKPGAAPQAAAVAGVPSPAAKPSSMAIPVEKLDTVFLAKGGRVRGLVTEEGPEGVVVRLVDGTERRYAPGQVSRIDWADGTRTELAAASAPPMAAAPAKPAPAAPAPPPAAAPAPAPAPAPAAPEQVAPPTPPPATAPPAPPAAPPPPPAAPPAPRTAAPAPAPAVAQ